MAIYIFKLSGGDLVSWIPDNITIAQAQTSGQLAPSAILTAQGLGVIDGLPPLSATVAWDAPTKTTVTITAAAVAQPMPTYFFLLRFTAAEYAAISASIDTATIQWWDAIRRTKIVDMTDPSIQTAGTHLISIGLLTSGRANTILTTPYVGTSQTS